VYLEGTIRGRREKYPPCVREMCINIAIPLHANASAGINKNSPKLGLDKSHNSCYNNRDNFCYQRRRRK